VYVVDIALARLGDLEHTDAAAARGKLLALAADAEQRHFLAWSLEAKLSAWELLRANGADSAAAQALRAQIEKSARDHGFGRILSILQQRDAGRAVSGAR
jgi:hypothetical protein